MAQVTPAYRMRPLDLGDILDEAFRIYRANFSLMVSVALVAAIPAMVTGIASGSGGLVGTFQRYAAVSQGSSFVPPDTSLLPLTVVGIILGVLMVPISTGAPIFAGCSVTLGMPATPGSILRDCLRNYWRLWAVAIIYFVTAALFILIITIPFVVWILNRWAFRYQVLYLERAGVTGSLTRSAVLVKNSWWRVFGVIFLIGLIVGILALILQTMFGLLALLAPAGLIQTAVSGVLAAGVQALLVPFSAIATCLLYLDQRVRKESLDLQLMAGQAGQVEPASPTAPHSDLPPAWGDVPPPAAG